MKPPARTLSTAFAAALAVSAFGALTGCGGTGTGAHADPDSTGAITADLFPFEAREGAFVASRGGELPMTVVPAEGGAVMTVGEGAAARRLDLRRAGDAITLSGGPGTMTELLRVGAAPGAEWASAGATVRFDGWERIVVPAGTFDAARVRTSSGPPSLATVETWWFARGVGLVRLRSDRGGIFAEELSLSR